MKPASVQSKGWSAYRYLLQKPSDFKPEKVLEDNGRQLFTRLRKVPRPVLCCCGVPFFSVMLLMLLAFLLLVVAGAVFEVIALAVASRASQTGCQAQMVVWLIVFGAVGLGASLLVCLVRPAIRDPEDKSSPEAQPLMRFLNLVFGLFQFAWLCYGMNLTLNKAGDFAACDAGLYYWFNLIAQFMFYTHISILCCFSVLVACAPCLAPTFVTLFEEEGGGGEAGVRQQPQAGVTLVPSGPSTADSQIASV
jgi:hypothetical protein